MCLGSDDFRIKDTYIAQVRCLFPPTLIVFINNRLSHVTD